MEESNLKKIERELNKNLKSGFKFPKPISEYLKKMSDYRRKSEKANFGTYGTA